MTVTNEMNNVMESDKLLIVGNMGHCHCGNTIGKLTVNNGELWATCHGSEDWQSYNGPAQHCHVSYGVGLLVQEIAEEFKVTGKICLTKGWYRTGKQGSSVKLPVSMLREYRTGCKS